MPTQLSKDKRKDKKKKQELLKRVEEYAAAEAAKPDLTLEVDMENNDDTEKDRKTTVMQKETLLTYLDWLSRQSDQKLPTGLFLLCLNQVHHA